MQFQIHANQIEYKKKDDFSNAASLD